MENPTIYDKLTPEARAKMDSWNVEKHSKALYWLTRNEYVYETTYANARWICFYFNQPLETFYSLFTI
jgi:hypothetical protein